MMKNNTNENQIIPNHFNPNTNETIITNNNLKIDIKNNDDTNMLDNDNRVEPDAVKIEFSPIKANNTAV